MTQLNEIRGRLNAATPGPWKAETYRFGPIEDGRIRVTSPSDTGIHNLAEDVLAQDAEFIANAPTDVARLLNAVQAVLDLHKPRTEQVITGDCAEESCGHEESDDCPKSPFEACAACWVAAEEADAYFSEGGVSIVAYPCPTVEALTAALDPS